MKRTSGGNTFNHSNRNEDRIRLLDALNNASVALQQASRNEAEVIHVFSEQIGSLGLRGGYGIYEESCGKLTIKGVFQTNKLRALLSGLENIVGRQAKGFTFELDRVDVYRQVVREREAIFVSDSGTVVTQMIPDPLQGFAGKILKAFGGVPGIFSPLMANGRVIGTLNIAGPHLTVEDVPSVRVFSDHFSIALENAKLFEELSASEERYRDLVESSLDLICTHDLEGNILSVNSSAIKILGYSREELLKMNIQELLVPADQDQFSGFVQQIIDRHNTSGEFRIQTRTGDQRTLQFKNTLRKDGIAHPIVRAMARDITDQLNIMIKMRESESRYRSIFEGVHDAIFVESANGQILDVNQSACDMFGYTHQEFLTLNVSDLVPPGELILMTNANGDNHLPEHPVETVNIRKNGEHFPIEISGQEQIINDQKVMLVVVRDITQRKEAEKEIRLQAEALQSAANAIVITDREGSIIWVNTAFTTLTGYQAEEALGQNPRLLRSGNHNNGYYRNMWETITNGQVWQGEIINKRKDGTLYTEDMTITPVFDRDSDINHFIAIKQDITERKETEKLLQHNAQQFEALYKIALDLSGSNDLDILLETILQRAKDLLNTRVAGIYLYNAEKDELDKVAVKGINITRSANFAFGTALINKVTQYRKPLIIQDYQTWGNRDTETEELPLSSILGIPMMYSGELLGVLVVGELAPKIHHYSQSDVGLLTLFAASAAGAVQNARQLNNSERRLKRLTSLRDIDKTIANSMDLELTLDILLGHIIEQLGIDAACILLYRPDHDKLKFVASKGFNTGALRFTDLLLGQGFAGKVALEQSIVQITDFHQLQDGFIKSLEFNKESFASYIGVPLIAYDNIIGVLEILHRQQINPDQEWIDFLETLAGQAAIAIDKIRIFENLQSSNEQLKQAYDATIKGWAQALELRDMEIKGHSQRVVDLTLRLAQRMGIDQKLLTHIHRGALLHDIGKMGVPDSILQKPGKLNVEEWEIMRQHPVYAYSWLSQIAYLEPALDIPYCHHEKWDGSGYPQGLNTTQIPLAARIFAIADVYDALTSDRPYRQAWSKKKTLEYIRTQSGKHFDPEVVRIFFEVLEDNH